MTLVLFIVFMTAALAKEPPVLNSKLADAHVSYDDFKLMYHTDIALPYDMKSKIETLVDKAGDICEEVNNAFCKAEMIEIREDMVDAQSELAQLEVYERRVRTRRGWCDTCGWAMKKAFGVMDSYTAKDYADKINQLQNETMSQHQMMREQVHLAETTLEVNREISQQLDEKTNKTIEDLKQVADELGRTRFEEEFGAIMQLITEMLGKQRRAKTKIKAALRETSSGNVPELIPPSQLEEDMQKIREIPKSDDALPIDFSNEPTTNIFSYAKLRSSKWERKILIEITIPIVSRMNFNVFKATPVPFDVSGYTMIVHTQTKYFLLDESESRYIALRDRDLLSEMRINDKMVIYRPTAIVRLDRDDICEWKAYSAQSTMEILEACEASQIPTANYVMEINENDIYFISVAFPMSIMEVCNDKVARQMLTEDRLLKIRPNCSVKTSQFTIQAKNTYEIDMDRVILPDLGNDSITEEQLEDIARVKLTKINISEPILVTEFHELDHLIDDMRRQARGLEYQEKFEQIREETVKSSIWSGIAFTLITLSIGAVFMTCVLGKLGMLKCTRKGTSGAQVTIIETAGHTPYPAKKLSSMKTSEKSDILEMV